MERGKTSPSVPPEETDLDGDESEDFDGDEDYSDEDEEDEPEPMPFPSRKRPPPNPELRKKMGKPIQPLEKEDLKTIILEKYEQGWQTFEIYNYLQQESLVDVESGEFLTIRQIGGYKSLTTPRTPPTQANPVTYQQPQPIPVAPVQQPTVPPQASIAIPRPRTKLDTFTDMLTKGMEQHNEGLVQIAVDGIYKEMDRQEGGGVNEQIFSLLQSQLSQHGEKSKLGELRDLVDIVSKLMPDRAEESEAVGMAKAIGDTAVKVAQEARETVLEVTGSRGKADQMGKCPNCEKIIPKDSRWCAYCGLSFTQEEIPSEEAEDNKAGQAERQKIADAERRRKDISRKAVGGGSRTATTPPKPQAPPAPAPAPASQPAKPTAPAPAPKPIHPTPLATKEERESVLKNLKKLANFITNKDDYKLKASAFFNGGDDADKKTALFLAILGRERLLNSGKKLIQEHPDLQEFSQYVELCDSVDGRVWIDGMLGEIKNQARLGGVLLKKEEAAKMLADMEAKIGFEIQ